MENRIRFHRLRLGWTQGKLAALVGTSPQQISRLERSERPVDLDCLRRLGAALQVSPSLLLPVEMNGPTTVPCVSYLIEDERERRLIFIWRSLPPESQDVVVKIVDAWSASNRRSRSRHG